MESPDTAIHSVKASTLAKEPRPTLLCLPRLSAPAGNALVGSPREAPQAGLDTDFGNAYLPVSLAEFLWKGGHFFLEKLGRGAQKQCLDYPLPLA